MLPFILFREAGDGNEMVYQIESFNRLDIYTCCECYSIPTWIRKRV